MSDVIDLESWAAGIINKRTPEAIRALSYLLEAGLRAGECSATDIPDGLTFTEPNVIGAVFKLLKRCGYVQDRTRWVKPRTSRKHGRPVPVWILADRWKAETVLQRIRAVLPTKPGQVVQLPLAM